MPLRHLIKLAATKSPRAKRPARPRAAQASRPSVAPSGPKIRREVKLRLSAAQEQEIDRWLWHLTGVYNWAIRRIELDAADQIYHTQTDFLNLLAGTAERLGIPSQVIQGTLLQAYTAWQRCFKKLAKKPKLKGRRRPLNSLHFPGRTQIPEPGVLVIRGFTDQAPQSPRARIRYKKQHGKRGRNADGSVSSTPGTDMIDALPKEALRGCRIINRASGWYASIVVAIPPAEIPRIASGQIGIDPGFKTFNTLSTGEKINHPKELFKAQKRLAQAQRGGSKRLAARIQERVARSVRDRNHKLSRRLVSENTLICYSKDNLRGMARGGFGKSVRAAAHGQFRDMLQTKSLLGGSRFVEVTPYKSTMTCSKCQALTGPTGRAGLKVRLWRCTGCGTLHERDVNSAVHTLQVGGGQPLESYVGLTAEPPPQAA